MALLDIFNSDFFGVESLTEAINKMPYQPTRLGQLGLFTRRPITTTSAVIEERHGELTLLATAARGTVTNATSTPQRKGRSFRVPHIPQFGAVMAEDVQNVRAFGTESQLEAVSQVVNDRLENMRQDHEVTAEWHRIGAIKGQVLDADGSSVIYDWFDEFDIVEKEVDFDFADADEAKLRSAEVYRHIRDSLGATTFQGVHALCGDAFFDALTSSVAARQAFDRWQEGRFFREQQIEQAFPYVGIMWENYRGKIGSQDFIEPDECRFFPTGTRQIFLEINAPADFVETVNTPGLPFYAKQERMDFDKGIKLHSQSNPLMICTRPGVLVKGVDVTPS